MASTAKRSQAVANNIEGASVAPNADGTITPDDDLVYNPPLTFITAATAGDLHMRLVGGQDITLTVTANERITFLLVDLVYEDSTAADISGAA